VEFHPVEANLRESFRALAAGRPDADIRELPGVSIASLGVAFQMFNAAFLSGPVSTSGELMQRLEIARLCLGTGSRGWAFWFCEDWIARPVRRLLTQTCFRFGLHFASELPGMIATELSASKRRPPQLEFRRASDPSTLGDFRSVGQVSFRVPPAWFAEVFHDSAGATCPGFSGWVGYSAGLPVATAATVISDGAIGLYNIATVPTYRGRGIAEAITRHVAGAARETAGPPPLLLQSTSMGHRMYGKLGFREVSRILVFNSNERR
jgi:GNAT superfamily N-acetyltransferase